MQIEQILESVEFDIGDCWKRHQGQSNVSYEQYSKERRYQLGETVLKKEAYLP